MKKPARRREIHEYACPKGTYPDLYCSCWGGPWLVEVPPCEHPFKHLRQKNGRIVCTDCGEWPEVKPLKAEWEQGVNPVPHDATFPARSR